MSTGPRYNVRIVYPDGIVAFLSRLDRSEWCLRTAKKHGAEFMRKMPKAQIQLIRCN